MVSKIISDCEQALQSGLYFAALSLALILPDICAKAKYPDEKSNKKRYVDWYDEYVAPWHKHSKIREDSEELPYASGEVIYSLRCSVLHQGTPGIDSDKCNISDFRLIWETQEPEYLWSSSGTAPGERHLDLPIRTICKTILDEARSYYESNMEQFNFFCYSVEER